MTSNPFDQFPRVTPENPFDQFPRVAPETPFDQPPAVGPSTRQVLEYAVQTNPDQAARAAQLAKQYQVPADVVQRNLQPVETKAAVDMAFADLQRSPRLTQSMRERPILAQQAHDDIVTLARLEGTLADPEARTLKGTLGDVAVTAVKGAVGLPEAFVGLADIVTGGYAGKAVEASGIRFKETQKILDDLYSPAQKAANKRVEDETGFLNTLEAMILNPSTILVGVGQSLPLMLGGAGVARGALSLGARTVQAGMAGPNLPGMLVRTFGEKYAPVIASAFGEGALAAGAAAEQFRGQNEDGLLTVKETIAAIGTGAGTAVFGFVGGSVARKLGLDDIDTVLASRGLAQADASAAKSGFVSAVLKAGISEGAFEELPQSVQEQVWQNWVNDRPLDTDLGKVAAQGVITGFAMGGGFQAINRLGDTFGAAQEAENSTSKLQAALQLASQSRLRERNPEEFRSLVQDMAADAEGSPQEIFIDAEVLNQLAPEVQQQLPESVLAQLGDALATNDVVSIPVADVLTIAPGTPLEQTIVEHGRVGDPMAMTRAEAVQVREQMPELVRAEAERILAQAQAEGVRDESEAVIRDQILGQLNTAGRQRPAVNEAYATLVARAYSTLARRMGMTATELFTERTASVAGTAQPGQDGTVLSQNGIRIRRTIDELVAATESQADWRTWYQRHEATLVEMFGNDADLFQKLLSATSQATGVKGNVTLALKAYDQLLSGQEFSGYLPAVIKNLERIRDDQALEGAKIAQYGKANEGDTSAIAVDRHIAMLFFNAKTPSKAQIEVAKTRIRKVADRLGWEPRQVQAALWAYNQVRLGTDPTKVESYDKILEARADFIAALRSRHGRGERGSVQAGGGTVQGGQEGPGAGSPDTDDGVLNQRKRKPAYYAGGKAWNPGYDYTQLPAEHQAIVDEHIARLDNPEVTKQKLLDYAGTAWAKQAIESAFVRDALERLMVGEQPRAPSWLDNTETRSVVKLREGLLKQGPKYAMAYLERNGLLGNPAKPEEAVAASYLKCEPSKECAESCYAAKNELRPSTLIKAELTDWLIATHPDVAAEITKREWDVSPLKQMGGALRLLDRGDADMKWIPYIDKLTEMGIRTHIFSKHPNVLAAMDPMHLRLLSIDRTSHDLIEQMPEGVGAAYVFAGTEEEIRFIAQHQDRIQVILPIKGTEEFASNADIAALPDSVSKKVCPVDHGYVRIATGYKVVVGKGKEKRVHFFRAKDSGGKLSLKQAREQALALSDGIGADARMIPLGGYALLDAEGNYLDHFTATEEGLAKAQQLAKSIGGRVEEINGWNCVNCDRKNGLGCYVNHTTTPQPQVHVINIAGLSLRKMQNEAERGIAKIESELGLRLDPDKRQRILDVLVEQLRQDRGGDVRSTEGDSTGQSQTQTAATAGSRQEAAGTGQPGGDGVLNQTATSAPKLMAVHNLTADNLIFSDRMGGLAVPSVGVVTDQAGAVDGFGEITLIGTKGLVDPKRTPVFSADAYTARFPAAEWSKVKSKDAQKVVDSIREAAKEFGDQSVTGETWDNMVNNPDAAKVVEVWLRSSAVRALFLREQGMDVQPVRRNIPSQTPIPVDRLPELKPLFDAIDINQGGDVLDSPEWAALAAAYRQIVLETYRAKGRPDRIAENLGTFDYRAYTNLERDFKNAGKDEVDIWETAKVLGEETDKRAVEFKKWVESKVMPPFGEPFIKVRGKKAPYTLDNIVAVMTDDKIRGKEKTMTYSAGQARAASSIQFSDVEQMREAAQRSVLDKDQYEAARAETEKKLDAFRTAVVEFTTIRNWKGDPDTWEALDASMRALAKFSTGKARGAAALRKALKAEEFDAAKIPDEVIEQGLDAALSLLSAPVPYFEAKPQRAVSLNEFAGAAIPQNAPQEVRDILAKHGVEVVEYADGERVQVAREFAADLSGRGRDTLFQERLGTFNPKSLQIVLNENANLSTFLHESGHLFLELLADLGTRPNAPADVRADLDAVMKWFGVKDAATWQGMTLNQKRMHHERFAESFEQYLLEGKAPSADLQPLFRKFSAWLRSVYRSLKAFIANTPDNGMVLNDDIRQVFDRMLASEEEIHKAEEIAGMVPDEYATEVAIEKLTARSVRDLKWTIGARNRTIKELQRKARTLRNQEMIIARREIMTRPVYRAWAFLTGRMTEEDALPENKIRKSDPRWIDETQDSLFQAIAKLGGIDREQLISQWGMDVKEKARAVTGFGGKRSVDSPNGMPIDQMGLTLVQYGYLSVDENGRYDQQEFEEKFFDGLQGFDHYSLNFDYDTAEAADPKNRGRNLTEFNSGRLDRALLAGFDKAAVTRLEDLGMVRNDGLHPDVVADIFGFASGEELVTALAAAEKPQAAIDGLTDQFMLEEHGDLVDQRAIEQAANEAIHNEVRARFLATELKGQADLLNERRDTGKTTAQGRKVTVSVIAEAAKQFAANVIGRTAIRDLKSRAWQHTAAERRAGKRWQEATAAGKTEEAVQAKRDQVLNNAAAKAALDAQARVKQITTFFRQVVKGSNEKMVEKGLDPDLINAARAILGAYGVAPKAAKSAAEYLKVMQANDPVAFAAMQPTIQAALDAAQPLEALTLDELEALHEEIQALWYKARRDRQIRVQGKLIAMEDAEDQLQARMQDLGVPDSMPGDTQALTKMDKAKRKLQYARALLRRVEQWAEAMDGKFGGPFTRLVFNPVKQAADDYRADRVKYGKKYQALVDAVAPFMPKGVIAAPELNYTFGKGHNGIGMAELLHAILHTGNTSNKRKLLLGRKWGVEWPDGRLDTSRWDAFLERLTAEGVLRKEHYDFAQGVWDLLEETKPLAQKTHRDVFGRFFEEVTAEAFDTPFGSYRGGYVPAQADPELVQDADLRKLAEAENENMVFAFPATNRGFTKGRVEYNRPLMLDLRTIGQHIDKVLLFSHMEPAVRDVNRLLSRKGVAYSLGRIDPTVYAGMLTPWLSRSARQVVETPVTGDGGISRITSALRARAGMALMFANISNTLQQITGFSLAAVKVKPSLLMKATAQFVKSPRELSANVSTASTFMAHRMENEVSAMNDAINQIVLDQGLFEKSQAWTRRHAYFLQTAMANTMEPIIWTAAYNQGIEQNMDPDEAVGFADNVIRTTQGSTLPEDVSRMETGPAYARIFTQFVGYFNMMANTNGTVLQQVAQELGVKKGAGKMLYVVALGLLVPLWVAEAIAIAMRGGPGDEDDDGYLDDWIAAVFGVGTIKGSLAMVPFVGQLANAAINRTNSNPADDRISLSPAVSFLEAGAGAVALPYKALTDPDSINARNAVRDVSSLLSLVTGLPFYAAARPLGYAAGVADDRIEPTGPVDAVRGLVTGSASPESK